MTDAAHAVAITSALANLDPGSKMPPARHDLDYVAAAATMTWYVSPGTSSMQEQCSHCQVAQGDCTVSMTCGGCTVREALSGVQLVRLLPAAYMLAEGVQARTSLFAMNAFQ